MSEAIIRDRVAGLSYAEIARRNRTTVPQARYVIKRAVLRGDLTREAARMKRAERPKSSDEAYGRRVLRDAHQTEARR